MEKLPGIHFLHQGEADQFIQRRVCARCYEDLIRRPVEDGFLVYCPHCNDAWGSSTISRRSAEIKGQQALAENYEVRDNLRDVIPNPLSGKSQTDLLKDLGF